MLHKAIQFAAMAHKGQYRKGSEVPYIVHPFEVAQILTAQGASQTLIAAGLLHDTLEDTSVTEKELEREFGSEVLLLIQSDSEDKSCTWEERKAHTVEFLQTKANREQKLLACADKLSNLRSIRADFEICGDAVWTRFRRGKEKQAWYYGAMLPIFREFPSLYFEYSQLYKEIFDK